MPDALIAGGGVGDAKPFDEKEIKVLEEFSSVIVGGAMRGYDDN